MGSTMPFVAAKAMGIVSLGSTWTVVLTHRDLAQSPLDIKLFIQLVPGEVPGSGEEGHVGRRRVGGVQAVDVPGDLHDVIGLGFIGEVLLVQPEPVD